MGVKRELMKLPFVVGLFGNWWWVGHKFVVGIGARDLELGVWNLGNLLEIWKNKNLQHNSTKIKTSNIIIK